MRLGDFPALSIENARRKAANSADLIVNQAVNPNDAKREKKSAELNFQEAFTSYIKYATARKKRPLRETTKANYSRLFAQHFGSGKDSKDTSPNWTYAPLSSITPEQATGWYNRASDESITSANSALAVARAIYSHTIKTVRKADRSALYHFNPFADIEQDEVEPRTVSIHSEQLPEWFDAVNSLRSQTTRDYLVMLLLTGMRRREASTLTWDRVDFKLGTLIIGERKQRGGKREKTANKTKSGNTLTLPLSDYLIALLKRRKESSQNEWVFPSPNSKTGYLLEPKTAIKSIHNRSGIYCSPHALRRTFMKLANDKAGVPFLTVKQLANHKQGNDVTERHYLNESELGDLQKHMQSITDTILVLGKQRQAIVTQLRAVK